MDTMSASIAKVDGHYQLPLPFTNNAVVFPNNRAMAEQSLGQLKRKFSKNPDFKNEYTSAMTKTFENGYAEKTPDNTEKKSITWYIPHHGVIHPQKKKLRVVFDCAARYQGVSLNQELIQGPDLTNSLVGVLQRFCQDHVALMADIRGHV